MPAFPSSRHFLLKGLQSPTLAQPSDPAASSSILHITSSHFPSLFSSTSPAKQQPKPSKPQTNKMGFVEKIIEKVKSFGKKKPATTTEPTTTTTTDAAPTVDEPAATTEPAAAAEPEVAKAEEPVAAAAA
ncbi:uncharacterized protein LY89DRAFT_729565 [Mollisia scopiformis]|uniref:Uncharacterized protein n=1 Tax=Mollisia scopiformis TaxID=149040 RepID=A0A194XPV7_MOLSC|nr:uncharacterized protein LY89DRAFT_729565 [Mollisia scopiformis]KUJ22089.1 hypothetical protein LY89DRAFT_729565 [Mollisia scopiformis]